MSSYKTKKTKRAYQKAKRVRVYNYSTITSLDPDSKARLGAVDFVTGYAETYGVSKDQARKIIESIFDYIADAITFNQTVNLPGGFGTFKKVKKEAHDREMNFGVAEGRVVHIPDKYKLTFKAGSWYDEELGAVSKAYFDKLMKERIQQQEFANDEELATGARVDPDFFDKEFQL